MRGANKSVPANILRTHQPDIATMPRTRTRTVAVNASGRRIGEDQTGAKLTNRDVDLLWALRDEGLGYGRLAAKFEVSKSLVRDIIKGRRRNQTPSAWKTVQASL